MTTTKTETQAEVAAAVATGAVPVTKVPTGRKGRPAKVAKPDSAPAKPTKTATKRGGKASAAAAKRAASNRKAEAKGTHGRFAADTVKLRAVKDAPRRTGVLGTIQAAVDAGADFGGIKAALAKAHAQARMDTHKFAVRFVGRAIRRKLVTLAK